MNKSNVIHLPVTHRIIPVEPMTVGEHPNRLAAREAVSAWRDRRAAGSAGGASSERGSEQAAVKPGCYENQCDRCGGWFVNAYLFVHHRQECGVVSDGVAPMPELPTTPSYGTDASGNPAESFNYSHYKRVMVARDIWEAERLTVKT